MAVFKTAGPGVLVKARPSSVSGVCPPPLRVVETAPSSSNQAGSPGEGNITYLDQGSKVQGRLRFDGPVQIDGEIEGEINSKDTVAIGADAVVSADINAVTIVVAGAISGELTASRRIEIHRSAKVLLGSLTAPEMVIDDGATIEGTNITKVEREDRRPRTSHIQEGLVAEPRNRELARRL